jgi:cyclopropane fatty-acyl-phospholipid synthase-like methyltransferase
MKLRQKIFAGMYRRVETPELLPWHRDAPALLRAAAERRDGGRALDIGCGTGAHAVYLAELGFSVVGVDFVPAALEHARRRADNAGVALELVQSDVLAYGPVGGFDVVVDSGCLHHVPSSKVGAYRALLDRWLLPGGDYLLVHFSKRHALDWRPVGPRRVKKPDIVRLFSPLRLEAYDETFFDLSFPIGRSLAGIYWFRRV